MKDFFETRETSLRLTEAKIDDNFIKLAKELAAQANKKLPPREKDGKPQFTGVNYPITMTGGGRNARVWTRGDGSKYRKPAKIVSDLDQSFNAKVLKDYKKVMGGTPVDMAWKFITSNGKSLGKATGEFNSDKPAPAYQWNGTVFIKRGSESIDIVTPSIFRNSWVWRTVKENKVKDFFELRENKIFFVKVGDGRDSMTVKTKAPNSREAVKKLKGKYPKERVSLDQNQKQGQPAGALESVKTEGNGQKAGMFESADTKAEVQKKQDFLDRLRGKPPVKKESSVEYGKSVDRIRDKQKNAAIKPKDRETLGKLADLMKKQKRTEAYRKPTQAEIDADKKKDGKSKGSSTRYRDMKKKMYGNAMGGLKKEESELTEAPDFMKMSKELLKHKSKGIEFEKAAAYIRAIHNNSNVNVQDKAFMGLTKMLKDMDDFTKKTTITKILKDNGFKVKGGKLMREFVELEEALVKVTDVEFNYRDQLPNSPKTSDLGAIASEWKQDRVALRDAVKKMGGLVTNTVAPSRGNKWVGTVTIGTRDDPSKLDDKSIQKAVKSHGIEIHSNQFRESTDNYGKSIDRIQAKKTRDSLTPSEKDKLAKLHALMKKQRKTGNYKMESADLEEKYAVKYTHPTDKKSGRTTGPMSKAAADKKAAMGNRVDKVGGKYTVIRHVGESVDEATMADRRVLKAVRIAKDMAGNHTGATRAIEKLKKGLSNHPKVRDALRTHNESVRSADKKPQNYRDPETGKMKVRMVSVDRGISSKKANESVELEERTNSVKYSRKDFENTKKGDKLEIKWGDSISSGRSATFVVAGKSASKKYNVEKLRLEPEGKKGGVKFFLRSRNGGDATFSIGDMAAIMTSIKKV